MIDTFATEMDRERHADQLIDERARLAQRWADPATSQLDAADLAQEIYDIDRALAALGVEP